MADFSTQLYFINVEMKCCSLERRRELRKEKNRRENEKHERLSSTSQQEPLEKRALCKARGGESKEGGRV